MEKVINILKENIKNNFFIGAVLSSPKNKQDFIYKRIDINKIDIKNEIIYQFECKQDKKVYHMNVDSSDFLEKILEFIEEYKNIVIFTKEYDYNILISKKGKVTIKRVNGTKDDITVKHNKVKKYIIPENEKCDFLIYLNIMNENGRVYDKKRDKYKQINKFLEIVENSLKDLPNDKVINIIDFGCGKAYLTFALYYYLVKVKEYRVNIVGLDIKDDVIEFCNKVSNDLGYDKLRFVNDTIQNYDVDDTIDMIVTLHACDIATDYALIKAINNNVKVILSVPCCQHELFKQIENENMKPLLKFGLIKERLSSLITDSMRIKILEILGYKVSVIEFIDIMHTPKNLMIKAIYIGNNNRQKDLDEYVKFKKEWNIEPILEKELKEKIYN